MLAGFIAAPLVGRTAAAAAAVDWHIKSGSLVLFWQSKKFISFGTASAM